MADAKEIGGYLSTAAGLGMEFSGFAPGWVFLQTIIFTISTALAVFDTYTDWGVVLNFKETGFNNPLLPRDDHWLRAWFFFASLGTLLTTISVLHDGIDLLYAYYKSCQKHCCKCSRDRYATEGFEMKEKGLKDDEKEESEEEIEDPCKCCFRHGWNGTTRNETLAAITLWFQDVPMLTLAVLYAFSQSTCKTPEPRDVTGSLLDVGISAIASLAAVSWRLLRSFARLYTSVGVRIKTKRKCAKRCLPNKREAAYPPDTCAQCCIFPFYFGLLMQIFAVVAAASISISIWYNYAELKQNSNFDDRLGIYRFSVYITPASHPRLFNLTGTLFSSNGTSLDGTFLTLEKIPYTELVFNDIYCLSEFEYRSENSQIYFNTVELQVVSADGEFCATVSGDASQCHLFYTFMNFALYYASVDPVTGELQRFDAQCSVVRDRLGFSTPEVDPGIDVLRHLDRTGYPKNGEPLIVTFLGLGIVHVSTILNSLSQSLQGVVPSPVVSGVFCALYLKYDWQNNRIAYNVKDVFNYQQSSCSCGSNTHCANFRPFYAYLRPDGGWTLYTRCSTIPFPQKLAPFLDSSLFVRCPCSQ